jgi:hypothetical protein
VDGFQNAGTHEVRWRPGNLPSGVYIARLRADGFSLTIKLMLQK